MSSFDAEARIWSGPIEPRDGEEFSFREMILSKLKSQPEKVFQISDSEKSVLTYSHVKLLSIRVAQNLHRFGVKKGDIVATFLNNSTYVAPIVFGCIFVGASVAPLTYKKVIDVEWIEQTFTTTRPKILILEEHMESAGLLREMLKALEIDCKIFLMRSKEIKVHKFFSYKELLLKTGSECFFELSRNDGITDDSIAVIIPSSGTTGVFKAIALSGNYLKGLKFVWDTQKDVTVFCYSTVGWFMGLAALFFPILNLGTRIITKHYFTPKHLGYMVKKYGVTQTFMSASAAAALYKSSDFNSSDYKTLQEFICGGERISRSIRKYLSKKLPKGSFGMVYGTTETSVITYFRENDEHVGDEPIGRLKKNLECRICDLSSGESLGLNEVGEILVSSETNFTGYFEDFELTEKAFECGWYKTGDVGYFDEAGYLHVYGRATDMISINDVKIHSAVIESVLENIEGVNSACAFEVADDLIAVLWTKLPLSNLSNEELAERSGEILPGLQIEGGFHLIDELPRSKTNSNRVNRAEAKTLLRRMMNLEDNTAEKLSGVMIRFNE